MKFGEAGIINIDGLNIACRISGNPAEAADTLVILQGWGTSYSHYDIVRDCLEDNYRVVQLDMPGFGISDEPERPWSVSDYGDFVVSFLKALDIKKCILLGHSYGGRVIIKLAAREELPFEIDRIILVDSAGVIPVRSLKQKLGIRRYKLLKSIAALPPIYFMFSEYIDYWKSRQGSEDYRRASPMMKKCMVMAVNEDLTGLLGRIKQEVLLVWGELDTATPLSDGKLMEKLIPNAGLAVIEGTGHFSFAEKPNIFCGIMRTYLGLN